MDLPLSILVAALAVGGSVPLLIYGLTAGNDRRDDSIRRNLAGDRTIVDDRTRVLQKSALERAIRPAIRSLAARARRLTPLGWIQGLERRLRLAGSPAAWPIERVLAAKVVCGILGVFGALYFLSGSISGPSTLIAAAQFAGGYFVPDLILWGRARERQQEIALLLPDTLDQMTISVEAGLGFDAALQRVAANTSGPLAEEIRRTLHEIKLGAGRQQALQHLVERSDVPELRHFVYAIRQAEEYGLPVAQVLRTQAGELRIKRRQRAEETALKLPVKILFPLVVCIFPALFIVLLGPAAIRISDIF
jgi:tight adherence protein C